MRPRLTPLEQFFCDACSKVIETPVDGLLTWRLGYEEKAAEFAIVHNPKRSTRPKGCAVPGERVLKSVSLDWVAAPNLPPEHPLLDDYDGDDDEVIQEWLGAQRRANGLSYLIGEFLDPFRSREPRVESISEFTEILRRLHIPYYEEARVYFDLGLRHNEFIAEGSWPYTRTTLLGLIHKYGDRLRIDTGSPYRR